MSRTSASDTGENAQTSPSHRYCSSHAHLLSPSSGLRPYAGKAYDTGLKGPAWGTGQSWATSLLLPRTTLSYPTLHYTTLHYTHYALLYYSILRTVLCCTTLCYITLYPTVLDSLYATPRNETLHCITLLYDTMLHYDTLHHTTLDYAALLEQRPAFWKST